MLILCAVQDVACVSRLLALPIMLFNGCCSNHSSTWLRSACVFHKGIEFSKHEKPCICKPCLYIGLFFIRQSCAEAFPCLRRSLCKPNDCKQHIDGGNLLHVLQCFEKPNDMRFFSLPVLWFLVFCLYVFELFNQICGPSFYLDNYLMMAWLRIRAYNALCVRVYVCD
jgi:hypothetical protein